MSFLDEFLKKPLPSAMSVMESAEDDDMDGFGFGDDLGDDEDDVELPGGAEDDEDIDIDGIDADDGDVPSGGTELSPEEDAEADSIIDIAATPVLMKQILSQESVDKFANSDEFDIAVSEGFAMEGVKSPFLSKVSNAFLATEAKFYQKNVVRFTKEARTNQLVEICVQAIARAKHDPDYYKLAKVQAARRKLKGKLRAKYKAQALKKAREYILRMKSSKSKTVANAAKQIAPKEGQ